MSDSATSASETTGERRHPEDLEWVWKALSNVVRRRILDLLRDGPQTTGAVASEFPDLSRFAVMQHMKVLEKAELINVHRRGRKRFNFLNPVPIQAIHDRWIHRFMRPWAEGLLDLRDSLEGCGDGDAREPRKEGTHDE